MDENIPGEMISIETNVIQQRAVKTIQHLLVSIPQAATRPMAARIWQEIYGSGHIVCLRIIHIMPVMVVNVKMKGLRVPVCCEAVPSSIMRGTPIALTATFSTLTTSTRTSVFV